jgi:hypothetical protein
MYPTCGFFVSNRVYLQRFLREKDERKRTIKANY